MDCNLKPKNFPGIYWQILTFWNEAKCIANEITTPFDIRRECLWFNKHIKKKYRNLLEKVEGKGNKYNT